MIRRYSVTKPSKGTVIPHAMKLAVFHRDGIATGGCVGFGRLPGDCLGGLEPDHVRASHGMGMKSVTCPCNLVSTCSGHHRYKTEHGREARPVFLEYLERFGYGEHVEGHVFPVVEDCGHVDPNPSCDGPCQRLVRVTESEKRLMWGDR